MTKKPIEIYAHEYERSHCSKPKGRGAWMFRVETDAGCVIEEEITTPSLSFSDAKVWAKAWVRENVGSLPAHCHSVDLVVLP